MTYRNYDWETEVRPAVERLIAQGADVYLKWTCPACGERVMADEPNTYYTQGFRHTEKGDGTPCGHVYRGTKFNYLVIWSAGAEERHDR